MNKRFIFLFFISVLLMSCSRMNKLSKEDYTWMPYNGNETLLFKSNTGETDTIFLLQKDTLIAYPEAQTLNGIEYEVVSVFCNNYGKNKKNLGRNYHFLQVQKAKDNRTELVFRLDAKDFSFYRLRPLKIDSLSKINFIIFKTSYNKYDDVYIIHPDNYAMDFYNRSDFITKLYWSKSEGLIRFDKKDSVYWELEKKY